MRKLNNLGKVSVGALVFVTAFVMVGAAYLFVGDTQAGPITGRKDTLSTSTPSTVANHTIQFTLNASDAFNAGETIILNFQDDFNTTGFANTDAIDYDIQVAATDEALVVAGSCASTDSIEVTTVNTTTDVFTFTACGSYTAEAAGSTIIVEIGANALLGGTGNTQITNPAKTGNTECSNNATAGAAAICRLTVSGTAMGTSTGDALVAIVEGVAVSASVAESLSFTIAAGAACAGDTGTLDGAAVTTTATTVPLGALNASTSAFKFGCQDLTVSTNAATGYNVTAEINTNLRDNTLADANDTIANTGCDTADTCTSDTDLAAGGGTWAVNSANQGFGYFCEQITNTPCRQAGTSQYHRFACRSVDADDCVPSANEAVEIVLTGNSPVSGNVGRIHYKANVSLTQPAGTYDDGATVTYIATGTF